MFYQVCQDSNYADEWRVEAINFNAEGECYIVIFSGPNARERAEEYAEWKNGIGQKATSISTKSTQD